MSTDRDEFASELAATEVMAVDLHGDLLMDVAERRFLQEETSVLLRRHYEALRAGWVKVQVLPVYIEVRYQPEASLRMALRQVASLYRELEEGSGEFLQIFCAADLEQVLGSEAIGLILALEGGEPLGRDIDLLSVFYKLGLRMVGMTWNRANLLAEGIVEDTGAGLSILGRRLVQDLGRMGIILDVSHLSVQSFWDALEHSTGPIVASHSNAAAILDSPRNLSDDQIKAIAERDGVIGLNFLPKLVGFGELTDQLAEHAAHISSIVGVRHVACGPDFVDYLAAAGRYPGTAPVSQRYEAFDELDHLDEYPSARSFPAFYAALLRRGFSTVDAEAILGGNAVRFLRQHL